MPLLADEEALSLHHLEVEDRLDQLALHGLHGGDSAQRAKNVAWPEVAGHHPALPDPPEPMDARRRIAS